MPGCARPVRMPAKASLATSTAFSIFSSASNRVSSIIAAGLLRICRAASAAVGSSVSNGAGGRAHSARGPSGGGDQRADLLAEQGAGDVAVTLHAEDDHRELVVHAQA